MGVPHCREDRQVRLWDVEGVDEIAGAGQGRPVADALAWGALHDHTAGPVDHRHGRGVRPPVEHGDLSLALAGAEVIDLLGARAVRLDGDHSCRATGRRSRSPVGRGRGVPRPGSAVRVGRRLAVAPRPRPVRGLSGRPGGGRADHPARRHRWMPSRAGAPVLADSPARRRAAERWTSDEPVLAALASAVGIRDEETARLPGRGRRRGGDRARRRQRRGEGTGRRTAAASHRGRGLRQHLARRMTAARQCFAFLGRRTLPRLTVPACSSRMCLRRCVPGIQPPRRAHRGGHPVHPATWLFRRESASCGVALSSRSMRRAQEAIRGAPGRTTYPDGAVGQQSLPDPRRHPPRAAAPPGGAAAADVTALLLYGRLWTCGPTAFDQALPSAASQFVDQVIAPRSPG